MGEQNISKEYFKKVRESNIVKKSLSDEKAHVTTGARLKKYAKTWWHERGGPGGVTEEYLKSIDAIHGAIPPGTTEEFFQSKIRPLLEVRAKAAGYAAMVGEVMTAVLTASWFAKRGQRTAQRFEKYIDDEVIGQGIHSPLMQNYLNLFRDRPSQKNTKTGIVIDNVTTAIVPNDQGYRRTLADDMEENVKEFYEKVSRRGGAVLRGSSALVGVAAGAGVLERGPVHAVAKLSAKGEGAVGVAVVKIVDRIVKGWDQSNGKIEMIKPEVAPKYKMV